MNAKQRRKLRRKLRDPKNHSFQITFIEKNTRPVTGILNELSKFIKEENNHE